MEKNKVEVWANKTLEEIGLKNIEKDFEKMFLDYAVFGKLEYPTPLTKEEKQAYLNKYNEDNLDQYTKIEYLSSKEVVEKYKEYLSEDQLKEVRKYDYNI